ncbi:signal transduction histidine kinase [Pedobacter cryoconitis]|uniref:Oxygen sensor histidine kinase NreB n=1 Tax=Pedobacter cryoconitis TaxID=188932 RepID=A0A7W8ZQ55_9SPHI|nr:sensor histidine kinase [Pedobacter cryoconitis]MBB5637940.1 signal transduction histidine kinase [Pedobacter cryoconitis]
MQISSKELILLIAIITFIFLIAPLFLIIYIFLYNKKKAKHLEEKEILRKTFELELLKTQIEVQEHILQTIASDLHDNIGQLLSLTSMTLSSIKTDHLREEKINTASELTQRAIKELRQLSKKMNGQELIKKSLGHAIAYELDWLKKGLAYEIQFNDHTTHPIPAHADKELIMFRLFQEILSNILKHAQASLIQITIDQTKDHLSLFVKDNGKGFIPEEKIKDGDGLGLFNLQKRTLMMDGNFTINSNPGIGTEIHVSIPYS